MPNTLVPAATPGLPASTRKRLEDAIDRLIAALDAFDPDPDIEEINEDGDGSLSGIGIDDEPCLGATEHLNQAKAWSASRDGGTDLEFDGETHACADNEPSLGSCPAFNQTRWASGGRDDREEECEDEGADIQSQPHDEEGDEPSLGSVAIAADESQEHWSQGDGYSEDCELEEPEPDGRTQADIAKARARPTCAGIFTQPAQAARDAARELARVQRGEKPAPKREPFQPYMCNGVLVIGRVR